MSFNYSCKLRYWYHLSNLNNSLYRDRHKTILSVPQSSIDQLSLFSSPLIDIGPSIVTDDSDLFGAIVKYNSKESTIVNKIYTIYDNLNNKYTNRTHLEKSYESTIANITNKETKRIGFDLIPHGEKQGGAIVFCHGIGIGLATYTTF